MDRLSHALGFAFAFLAALSMPPMLSSERTASAVHGVVVALNPASRTVSVGDLFSLEVAVNAGSQEVDVVDACVNFDRSVLRVVDPSNGSEMPDGNDAAGVALVGNMAAMDTVLVRQVVNSRGQVNYSAARLNAPYPSGSFRLATLHFKAVAPSAGSPVTFNTTAPRFTLAARAGEQVGGGGSGATIVVGAAAAGTFPPAPTPMPPATATPSAAAGGSGGATPAARTPVPAVATVTPGSSGAPPVAVPADERYFPQTGFRVNRDSFWDYFQKRGGVRTFGYPVSREFTLLGFPVQLFQRSVLQQMPNGGVATMNLLDEGLMPYTQINFSTFPAPERELIQAAPSVADPDYADRAIGFLRARVPDRWQGMDVDFLNTFLSTVRYQDAFPEGDGEPGLVPLLNLELWGLPTSEPAFDPNNRSFVYQRFQRGIMHYDASTGATQGLLLGDYLKSIITGQGLPLDLEQQARGSHFFRQYDPARPGYLARPDDLVGSRMVDAFHVEVVE